MDEQATLEKELNDEILRKAKIMTQISRARSELARLENEKSDSTLKISKIRYQLYEREDDK